MEDIVEGIVKSVNFDGIKLSVTKQSQENHNRYGKLLRIELKRSGPGFSEISFLKDIQKRREDWVGKRVKVRVRSLSSLYCDVQAVESELEFKSVTTKQITA
jgi:hypothetical protein